MADQDESQAIKASQDEYKKEEFSQPYKADSNNGESSQAHQEPPVSGQTVIPGTPGNKPGRSQTPPQDSQTQGFSTAPQAQSNSQEPQSSSQQAGDEGSGSEQANDDSEQRHQDEEVDPEKLLNFDWDALEEEYFEALNKADIVDSELGEEFKLLVNYFVNWSNVSYFQDQERAIKRFKTRREHVTHSEDMFNVKKVHYERVVEAFKAAMGLLQSD